MTGLGLSSLSCDRLGGPGGLHGGWAGAVEHPKSHTCAIIPNSGQELSLESPISLTPRSLQSQNDGAFLPALFGFGKTQARRGGGKKVGNLLLCPCPKVASSSRQREAGSQQVQ